MKKITPFITSFIFLLLVFGFFAIGHAALLDVDDDFSDVPESHMNMEAIDYLKDQGVVEGYMDGTYKPGNEINRVEFVKIIMGAAYNYDPGQDPSGFDIYQPVGLSFNDIQAGEWYIPYLRKAVENEVIDGYPDGTFKPADSINFAEAAKIIAEAFNVELGEGDVEAWYKEYVTGLEGEDVIPISVDYFDEDITRDEMAEMIWRLMADVTDKSSRTYDEINGEGLVTVASCAELQTLFEDLQSYNTYDYFRGDIMIDMMEDAEFEMAVPTAAPASEAKMAEGGGGGAAEYSTTNIQVEGVDEADIIKNDGKYIYLIKGDTIRIVDAYPADGMEELVSFTLGEENEDFYPNEMYVDGDQLTVIGDATAYYLEPFDSVSDLIYPPYYSSSRTKVYVVDISDRNMPTVDRTVEFEGNYNTSRKIGGTLYMVMNRYVGYIYPMEGDYDDILPVMRDSKVGEDEMVAPCGDIMIFPKPRNLNYIITAAVPLDDLNQDVSRTVVVGNSDNVYASLNNMYVAVTNWGGFYRPYGDYGTAIYKYSLGDGTIEFESRGKVPGTVLNQFSMDESAGHFRIATTKDDWDTDGQTTNALYVLGSGMDVVGKIENIARGERIYSVRFVGDRAYMVTFKRVDPLFVIDLSNARAPKILGKLKIPGYSTYLHPYDENHLLGFGKEVEEEAASGLSSDEWVSWELVQGVKIGMFDVTDVNHPKELFKEVIGDRGTYTELLDNHKALLFDKEKELLAFPISVVEIPDEFECRENTYSTCPPDDCRKLCVPSSCTFDNGITVCTADCDGADSCIQREVYWGDTVFDGAYVYTVNLEDGFSLRGTITHYNEDDMASLEENGYTNWQKSIQRILYIGNNLYSVSRGVVMANDMDDVSELSMIELAGEDYDFYPVLFD